MVKVRSRRFVLITTLMLSSSDTQVDGMELIEEKQEQPSDLHNPPMETEEIVSVLERGFLVWHPPPHPSNIAHLFLSGSFRRQTHA